MNNIESLIKFNHAYTSYRHFLIEREPNDELNQNDNHEIMRFLFAIFNFILNEEKIKTEEETDNGYLENYILDQIICIIAVKHDNKYYIDNNSFNSSRELIKVLRDKLAHGDFSLSKDNKKVDININGKIISIELERLTAFITQLTTRLEFYTTEKEYTRTQTLYRPSNQKTSDESLIDNLLNSIYLIDYNFKDNKGIKAWQKEKIEEILEELQTKDLDELKKSKRNFKKANIIPDIKIKSIKDTPYYPKLKSYLEEHQEEFQECNLETQIRIITNWIHKTRHNDEIISTDLYYNEYFLRHIKEKKYSNCLEAFDEIDWISLKNSYPEMILVTELIGFYIHYYYPLENICKSKDGTNEDYFDYRKLDLSFLKPDIFILPESRKKELLSSIKGINKKMVSLFREYESLSSQKENLQTQKSKKNKEAINRINESLHIIKEKLSSCEKTRKEREDTILEFLSDDTTSYYYNRYLIEYIRNAIAHNNVYFYYGDPSGNIYNYKLRFISKKKDKVYLDLTMSLLELEQLITNSNLSILNDYLEHQNYTP